MKSDPGEYKEIIRKLLEKTRLRKVEWEQNIGGFQCTVASAADSFVFTAFSDENGAGLRMSDSARNTVFYARASDLPISPEEEEVSLMIDEIYNLARRQALRIELKLEQASALLDQV